MVDFAKIRAQNKIRTEIEKNKFAVQRSVKWSWPERVQHIISHHLQEITNWEEAFLYSQIEYISEVKSAASSPDSENINWDIVVSLRVQNKLKEIEDTYCGQICHALQQAGTIGVNHG